MAWCRIGQVTVQGGSRSVFGVGTAWLAQVLPGEGLDIQDGRLQEIAEVISNTELLLVDAYAGGSAAGVAYQIIPSASMTKELTRRVNTLLATHEQMTADVTQAYALTLENAGKISAAVVAVEGGAKVAAEAAQSADDSRRLALADSDSAMGYRNESRAARDDARGDAAVAAQARADAVAARDVAAQSAASIDPASIYQALGKKIDAQPNAGLMTDAERAALAAIKDAPENVIYNAYCELAQTGTSGTVINDRYSLDGWKHNKNNSATTVWDRVTLASTAPLRQSGTTEVLALFASTPQTSLSAENYEIVGQVVEAGNAQQFIGKSFVVGMWLQPNKAGVYSIALRNPASTHSYVKTFNLAAGVPQLCSFVVEGGLPTSAIWPTSGPGLIITLCLASGSNYIAQTTGGWIAGNKLAGTGQVNLIADGSDSAIYVTGLSLCLGSAYRKPRKKTIQQNLLECQRYVQYTHLMQMTVATAAGQLIGTSTTLSPPMYATPSIQDVGPLFWESTNTSGAMTTYATSDAIATYATSAVAGNVSFSRRYLLKAQL